MATEFTLRRADGLPFGSFDEVKSLICRLFPEVKFFWTRSGPESLRLAEERGIEFPEQLRKALETSPSLLEGVAEGPGYHVSFGLGHEEPVSCLYVEPRGDSTVLERGLSELEAEAGAELKIAGEE